MSYEVVLTPAAEADLVAIPRPFREVIAHHLVDLAARPVTLSRPAVFPYPPGRQIYEFDVDYGGQEWDHFAILFRYGQDEGTLIVVAIGHSKLRRLGPNEDWNPD